MRTGAWVGDGVGIRRHFSAVHVAGKRFPFPRFELLNMLLSFKTDVTSKDADRVGIAKSLLNQYYKAYYSRDLAPRSVGQETVEGVLTYFKDVVKVEDYVYSTPI